jgi:hypothetical protein
MFAWLARAFERRLAGILNRPVKRYRPFDVNDEHVLARTLRPGDVLLVEGNRRISCTIKYLTQSTWSHAALYVGDIVPGEGSEKRVLIEVDVDHGVIASPLSKYRFLNTRICRPSGLSPEDARRVAAFAVSQLGHAYDPKNVFDLMRYLLPGPLVPPRFRRRLLAFGSGDPTRAICSTFLAQAFQLVQFPILPRRGFHCVDDPSQVTDEELLRVRHHSHFTPRDFDVSPYFAVVKPTLEAGFAYKELNWQEERDEEPVTPLVEASGE